MTPTNPAAPPAGSAQTTDTLELGKRIIRMFSIPPPGGPTAGEIARAIDALAQARVDAATLAHRNSTQWIDRHLLQFPEARRMRDEMLACGIFSWASWIITYIESLHFKHRELDAATRELREALEMLRDHQNGPPLPSWEAGWNKAMQMADAALERTAPR